MSRVLRSLFALVVALTSGACRRADPPPRIDVAGRLAARPALGGAGAAGLVVGVEGVRRYGELSGESLARLRGASVFFGHQSVGANVLDGARALGFEFQAVGGGMELARAHLGEGAVADNGDPERKIRSFVEYVDRRGIGLAADVAGFKFCWIDFTEDTNVAALEASYARALEGLHGRYPQLRLFHVTPPLTADEAGPNRVRLAFGERLKARYAPRAVVFDLAEVESTRDDGTRCSSGGVASLCDEYRSDSGHLSEAGAQRAARAFVYALYRALTLAP